MAIYEIDQTELRRVAETTFRDTGVRERQDLQRVLRVNLDVVAPDTLLIAEEFGAFEGSSRRIDLLGLDRDANLVVIELKRTDDGGHMELQSIRYAAMVSTMTFDHVVDAYVADAGSHGSEVDEEDARSTILEFLGWDEPRDDEFAQRVRIVLASADFSKEITTAVLWLNEQALDIRCVRLKPYELDGRTLIEVSQVVPLPEAADYLIGTQAKRRKGRGEKASRWDEQAFFDDLTTKMGPESVTTARNLLAWSEEFADRVKWGSGQLNGSFAPWIDCGTGRAASFQLFVVRSDGRMVFRCDHVLRKLVAFGDTSAVTRMREALNTVGNIAVADSVTRPRFRLNALESAPAYDSFLEVAEAYASDLRATVDADGSMRD